MPYPSTSFPWFLLAAALIVASTVTACTTESMPTTSSGPSSSTSSGASSSAGSTAATGSADGGAPTWTAIYDAYLAAPTQGRCASCHAQMSSASGAYDWLSSQGYMAGSSPALTETGASCLSWYGGNMPPGASSDAQAVAAMNAWAAAGAKND
jgi:hypothetical protein